MSLTESYDVKIYDFYQFYAKVLSAALQHVTLTTVYTIYNNAVRLCMYVYVLYKMRNYNAHTEDHHLPHPVIIKKLAQVIK